MNPFSTYSRVQSCPEMPPLPNGKPLNRAAGQSVPPRNQEEQLLIKKNRTLSRRTYRSESSDASIERLHNDITE